MEMQEIHKLTDLSIHAIEPPERGQAIYKDAGSPLQLRVSPGGAKTFFTVVGSGRRHTIGRFGEVGLKEARDVARRIRAEKTLGRYSTHSIPVEQAREQYFADITVRPSTRRYYHLHLNKLKGKIVDITPHDINYLLAATPQKSRNSALATYSAFFNWAIRKHYLEQSPCYRMRQAKSTPRARVLSDEELVRIWRACEDCGRRTDTLAWPCDLVLGDYKQSGNRRVGGLQKESVSEGNSADSQRVSPALPASFCTIVKLLILTGQRRGEIAALQTSWLQGDTIVFPASATKNKHQHSIPLSSLAISTLQPALNTASQTKNTLLFPAQLRRAKPFNNWSMSKAALDRRLGGTVGEWHLHLLRHYFASTMARLGVKQEVTERLLNHRSGIISGIAAVYQHYDFLPEMRSAVDLYQEHLQRLFKD